MTKADSSKKGDAIRTGTYRQFSYRELKPNPQNPRRLFDEKPLQVLRDSIRANGILVPITVYLEERNNQYCILDGERRWRCAELIENDADDPQKVKIPANIVAPPTPVANILWMFNIHNLREQWDLMPTALSLNVLIKELGETSDRKLSELTKLSVPNVKRCRILLSYRRKYQERMLAVDRSKRIRANFFIELHPVLDLYMELPTQIRCQKTRDQLIQHFLSLYEKGTIASVIHFRRILEAHDYIEENGRVDEAKESAFLDAAQRLVQTHKHTIRQLFDPLTAEGRSADRADKACQDFLATMRKIKVAHVSKRSELRKRLNAVRKYVAELLVKLEG